MISLDAYMPGGIQRLEDLGVTDVIVGFRDMYGRVDEPLQNKIEALRRYEALRLEPTARIVETNRTVPPDFIIMKADELSGHRPFAGSIDDLISQEELRKISEAYKDVAGFSLEKLKAS